MILIHWENGGTIYRGMLKGSAGLEVKEMTSLWDLLILRCKWDSDLAVSHNWCIRGSWRFTSKTKEQNNFHWALTVCHSWSRDVISGFTVLRWGRYSHCHFTDRKSKWREIQPPAQSHMVQKPGFAHISPSYGDVCLFHYTLPPLWGQKNKKWDHRCWWGLHMWCLICVLSI